MSLSTFLREPAGKALFAGIVVPPSWRRGLVVKVPRLSKDPALVGIAFDYLLRFELQRRYRPVDGSSWVAEQGLEELEFDVSSRRVKRFARAQEAFSRAVDSHAAFLRRGRLTTAVTRAAVDLALLDRCYRAGPEHVTSKTFSQQYEEEQAELRSLSDVVPWHRLTARRRCVLNPSFGDASELVGGADGDLLLDDRLIDVKTVFPPSVRPEMARQLLGYYSLLLLGGAANDRPAKPPRRVGIYLSRAGVLLDAKVSDLLPLALLFPQKSLRASQGPSRDFARRKPTLMA